MTTDQEKSATPFPDCKYQRCDLPGQCTAEGKCHHPKCSSCQEIERANIQLREELKVTDYLRDTVHKQRDQIVELMKKLSAATEQLAIAQAREVRLRDIVERLGCYLPDALLPEWDEVRAMPIDRTALDEEIRKARVQVLKDVTDILKRDTNASRYVVNFLTGYANSLTPTSQQSTELSE